jgi:hypothetical protein
MGRALLSDGSRRRGIRGDRPTGPAIALGAGTPLQRQPKAPNHGLILSFPVRLHIPPQETASPGLNELIHTSLLSSLYEPEAPMTGMQPERNDADSNTFIFTVCETFQGI